MIQLIHQMTKEYLTCQSTEANRKDSEQAVRSFLVDPEKANTRIARCCLEYNQRQGLEKQLSKYRFSNVNMDEACEKFAYFNYASLNWTFHLSYIRSQPASIISIIYSVSAHCFSASSLTWMVAVMNFKDPDTLLSVLAAIRNWAESILAMDSLNLPTGTNEVLELIKT